MIGLCMHMFGTMDARKSSPRPLVLFELGSLQHYIQLPLRSPHVLSSVPDRGQHSYGYMMARYGYLVVIAALM